MKNEFIYPLRVHIEDTDYSGVVSRQAMRGASVIFDQCLRFAGLPDTLLCKAEIKLACVDGVFKPCPLPALPILQTMRRPIS